MRSGLLAVLALTFAVPAQANDIQYEQVIICDTQKQAERLGVLLEENEDAAIQSLNSEVHNPTACAHVNVAFVRGGKLGTVRNNVGAFEMVEILVLGVGTRRGIRPASPSTFVMLSKIAE